jgi:hypothetical protein
MMNSIAAAQSSQEFIYRTWEVHTMEILWRMRTARLRG